MLILLEQKLKFVSMLCSIQFNSIHLLLADVSKSGKKKGRIIKRRKLNKNIKTF